MRANNICLEGYCIAVDPPCKQKQPNSFCLQNNLCPYFIYAETTEREVAEYVPLYLILIDRLRNALAELQNRMSFFIWHTLKLQNKRIKEINEFFDNIPSAPCPEFAELEDQEAEFKVWFEQVGKAT
jgi:hypothetical protein